MRKKKILWVCVGPKYLSCNCSLCVFLLLTIFKEQATRSDPLSRELSLWEWRHWQHKTLPSHVVDHSLRCQHFIHIMDLIDQMKEEKEVRRYSFVDMSGFGHAIKPKSEAAPLCSNMKDSSLCKKEETKPKESAELQENMQMWSVLSCQFILLPRGQLVTQ